MSATIRWSYPVLDAPDPLALAEFYAEVLGWTVTRSDGDWAEITGPQGAGSGFQLAFQETDVLRLPDWPEESVVSHLDFDVDSFADTEATVLRLGARRLDGTNGIPENATFRVYADPVGHVFCLCLQPPQ